MKSNELRIGNYVFSAEDNKHGEVFQIDSSGIIFVNKNGNRWQDLKNIQPIPLTEEILFKCGFEKVKNKDKEYLIEYIGHTAQKARYAIFGTDIFITKVDKRGLLWRSIDCDFMVLFYHKSIPIKYLHQLQNLYFALTGQELEINL